VSIPEVSLETDGVVSIIEKLDGAIEAALDALLAIGAHEENYDLPAGGRELAECLARVQYARSWLKSETEASEDDEGSESQGSAET